MILCGFIASHTRLTPAPSLQSTGKNLVHGTVAALKESDAHIAKFAGECGGATEVHYPISSPARPFFSSAARQKLKLMYPPLERLGALSSLKVWAEVNKGIVADDMPRADVRHCFRLAYMRE